MAADRLLLLVYKELRRTAQALSHEKPGQILDATARAHEWRLRLGGPAPTRPGHFFAAASSVKAASSVDAKPVLRMET